LFYLPYTLFLKAAKQQILFDYWGGVNMLRKHFCATKKIRATNELEQIQERVSMLRKNKAAAATFCKILWKRSGIYQIIKMGSISSEKTAFSGRFYKLLGLKRLV